MPTGTKPNALRTPEADLLVMSGAKRRANRIGKIEISVENTPIR